MLKPFEIASSMDFFNNWDSSQDKDLIGKRLYVYILLLLGLGVIGQSVAAKSGRMEAALVHFGLTYVCVAPVIRLHRLQRCRKYCKGDVTHIALAVAVVDMGNFGSQMYITRRNTRCRAVWEDLLVESGAFVQNCFHSAEKPRHLGLWVGRYVILLLEGLGCMDLPSQMDALRALDLPMRLKEVKQSESKVKSRPGNYYSEVQFIRQPVLFHVDEIKMAGATYRAVAALIGGLPGRSRTERRGRADRREEIWFPVSSYDCDLKSKAYKWITDLPVH